MGLPGSGLGAGCVPGTTSDLQRLRPQERDKLPAGPVRQGSGRESPQEEEEEQGEEERESQGLPHRTGALGLGF